MKTLIRDEPDYVDVARSTWALLKGLGEIGILQARADVETSYAEIELCNITVTITGDDGAGMFRYEIRTNDGEYIIARVREDLGLPGGPGTIRMLVGKQSCDNSIRASEAAERLRKMVLTSHEVFYPVISEEFSGYDQIESYVTGFYLDLSDLNVAITYYLRSANRHPAQITYGLVSVDPTKIDPNNIAVAWVSYDFYGRWKGSDGFLKVDSSARIELGRHIVLANYDPREHIKPLRSALDI